jgi:hypothetical protein
MSDTTQGAAITPRSNKSRTRPEREGDGLDATKEGLTAPVPAVQASPAATFSGLPSFTEPPPAPLPAGNGDSYSDSSHHEPNMAEEDNPYEEGSANYERWRAGIREPAPIVTGEIDVSGLVKAQAEFVWANTQFVKQQFSLRDYSYAQGRYIEALSEVLRQVGVF